jgi:hypothetical protein
MQPLCQSYLLGLSRSRLSLSRLLDLQKTGQTANTQDDSKVTRQGCDTARGTLSTKELPLITRGCCLEVHDLTSPAALSAAAPAAIPSPVPVPVPVTVSPLATVTPVTLPLSAALPVPVSVPITIPASAAAGWLPSWLLCCCCLGACMLCAFVQQ